MTRIFRPCYSEAAERVPVKDFGKGEVFFETPASRKLVDLIERNADELTARWGRHAYVPSEVTEYLIQTYGAAEHV